LKLFLAFWFPVSLSPVEVKSERMNAIMYVRHAN
jgi:hypothetical protein